MQELGNLNLFYRHFVMGAKLPSYQLSLGVIEPLKDWIKFKDSDYAMDNYRTCFTRSITFPQIIPIDIFKAFLNDIISTYKKSYPYAQRKDFLDTILGYTIYDLNRFISKDFTWYGGPTIRGISNKNEFEKVEHIKDNLEVETEFSFYYDYDEKTGEYLDYGIPDNLTIEYYQQYFSRILETIKNLEFDITLNIPEKSKFTLTQVALIHLYTRKSITKKNANEIAKSFGHQSGHKLYILYNNNSRLSDRLAIPDTGKKLINKINLFEQIIDKVPEPHKIELINDIQKLKLKAV